MRSTECPPIRQIAESAALTFGAKVEPVTLAAYEIARPTSKRDAKVRAKLATALDYDASNASAGIAARKSKTKS